MVYQVDLGDQIPEALYVVIAEILSFAYRISGKHKTFMDNIDVAESEFPDVSGEIENSTEIDKS